MADFASTFIPNELPLTPIVMKQLLQFLLCGLLLAPTTLLAQMGFNAPVGLAPRQDMEIYTRNGFLVQRKFNVTTADPNASINTLSCAVSPPNLSAQAGILKDPGGDSNYPASLTCTQIVFRTSSVAGYEVIFEDLDTEFTNDLVIITDVNSNSLSFSGSILPAPFFVAGSRFDVRFQANGNGTVGRGFRLRWREVFVDLTTSVTPNTAFGNALQFDANKGALHSGYLSTGSVERAGFASSALGYQNTASGNYSSALGLQNTASGNTSTALGNSNTVDGSSASALGLDNVANGNFSTALGTRASTGGFQGAMALGDYTLSSNTALIANTANTAANQLTARFSGGYRFISGYNAATGASIVGVTLIPGGNSWAAISDSAKKEHFRPMNHTEVLGKLGSLRLGSWNYKGQPDQRHYGPMAQDFFARFGHDGIGVIGCDTLLAGHDFTAITLAGVQALIEENKQLKAKLERAEARLGQVEHQTNAKYEQAIARLEALENAIFVRRRGKVVTRK